MKNMHAEEDRNATVHRIRLLHENTVALWGKFTAPRMIAHLSDSIRMGTGELAVAEKQSILRYWPLKQLIIYVAPFPKNVPTAPELLARAPLAFRSEVEDLRRLLEQFALRDPRAQWPRHPVFGAMSGGEWGALAYRHCDHHLGQFGV